MRLPCLLTVLLACPAVASNDLPALSVAFGLAVPPYVIKEKKAGMEYEVLDKAFLTMGFHMRPVYLPQSQLPEVLVNGQVDAVTLVNEHSGVRGHYSAPYIRYHDFAITLSSRQLVINRIEDLARYSVAAFAKAPLYLGDTFRQMASANPRYTEYDQQLKQNWLLYHGKVDVVVADANIFRYYNQHTPLQFDSRQPVTYHQLFDPVDYKVAFRDAARRDQFNTALAQLKSSGEYARILSKYQ